MDGIYLDACCIIYLHEGAPPFQQAVVDRLRPLKNNLDARLLTSRLSRLECRTRPLKEGNQLLLERYEAFFSSSRLTLGEITASVVERATELRARYGFRTPDALHLASAVEQGVSLFLTGDHALARCTEVRVEVLTP